MTVNFSVNSTQLVEINRGSNINSINTIDNVNIDVERVLSMSIASTSLKDQILEHQMLADKTSKITGGTMISEKEKVQDAKIIKVNNINSDSEEDSAAIEEMYQEIEGQTLT